MTLQQYCGSSHQLIVVFCERRKAEKFRENGAHGQNFAGLRVAAAGAAVAKSLSDTVAYPSDSLFEYSTSGARCFYSTACLDLHE